jgi:RNA polymerase sigma-70 factor (ECF subfamily)
MLPSTGRSSHDEADHQAMNERADASELQPDPDGATIARFRAGERAAFDDIVRKYEAPIRRLVLRYVKVEEDAKDLAQRTFTQAFQALESFRAESHFRTWLFRIAVNLAVDHTRGAYQTKTVPLSDDAAFTNSLGTEKLVAAEVWRKVSARLAELPPRQRLVFELRTFHELSFEEVAAVVGSSEDAAKVNYHHALKRLRSLLPPVQ